MKGIFSINRNLFLQSQKLPSVNQRVNINRLKVCNNTNILKIGFSTLGERKIVLPSSLAKDIRKITKADLLDLNKYEPLRKEFLKARRGIKSTRSLVIGPNAIANFENYDLLWIQIQEMLCVEKGGDKQAEDELSAYNPLLPQGDNLIFTFMLQYPDPQKRKEALRQLGHIEDKIFLNFEKHRVQAVSANPEIERTTIDGKTSSVHFLCFKLTREQITDFKTSLKPIVFSVEHPKYFHSTGIDETVLQQLRSDLL